MKIEVKIVSLTGSNITMAGSYPYKGKLRIWHDLATVSDFDNNLKPGEKHPPSNDLQFDNVKKVHIISYDVDDKTGKPSDPLSIMWKDVHERFLNNHPLATVNGKEHANTASPLFDITDKQTEIITKLVKWDRKRKVANFLAEAEPSDVRDIMFYFGFDPKGKSKGDICMFLADFSFGYLFQAEEGKEDRTLHFLNTFAKDINPDSQMAIHARKAIAFGIIETRNVNGKAGFYHLSNYCGGDVAEIVDYFKRNEKIYTDYVVRKIKETDHFAEEMKLSEIEKTTLYDNAHKGELDEDLFRKQVMDLAKDLSDKGVEHGYAHKSLSKMKAESLKKAYDDLKEKEKAAEVPAT